MSTRGPTPGTQSTWCTTFST
ncbi:unnamed protein product [Spirodela intermedia]|uniref:Uncharacterized protein n=1 Tax=Spirodela intermedia TaxID=51605 RepID=A0A7I8I9I1_SPIIN|nr:unnamed protein product [Spirodela intermedia]CAA6654178.1 unnamed protein product [Spirodela intermedia]